jgi:hypothetical protein
LCCSLSDDVTATHLQSHHRIILHPYRIILHPSRRPVTITILIILNPYRCQ